jgi:hypothetical protein
MKQIELLTGYLRHEPVHPRRWYEARESSSFHTIQLQYLRAGTEYED